MFRDLVKNLPRQKLSWVICGTCDGHGKVENPAFSNGFTGDEWNDMDYEDRERYLEGAYDVPCRDCNMQGKVQVPNMAMLTFAEKRPFARARMESRDNAEIDRIHEMERRMGA